jgi:hypothetical protein
VLVTTLLVAVALVLVGYALLRLAGGRADDETQTPSGHGKTDWPGVGNTGDQGDLKGSIPGETVDKDGATIENVTVDGQLVVDADHVTLRNVHVRSSGYYGVLVYGKDVLIEDTTIEGVRGTEAGLAADKGGWFTARRVDVSRAGDGVRLTSGSALYDSYVHDLFGSKDGHFDGVTADGYVGWRIVHNTIVNQNDQTSAVWVGDPRYAPSSGVLKDNLLAGGGYTVYGGPGAAPGVRVVGNFFSTRYFPRSGGWGPVANWDPKGNLWAHNVWADGPDAGKPVTP